MFLLYCGAQNWTQHSRCGLTSLKRGKDHLHWSVRQYFVWCSPGYHLPQILWQRQVLLNLMSSKTSTSFSAELLSIWLAPASADAWFSSFTGTGHSLLNFMRYLSSYFFSLYQSLWIATWPSDTSATPVLCHLKLEGILPSAKSLNWTRLGNGCYWAPTRQWATDHYPLELAIEIISSTLHCLLIQAVRASVWGS